MFIHECQIHGAAKRARYFLHEQVPPIIHGNQALRSKQGDELSFEEGLLKSYDTKCPSEFLNSSIKFI